MANRVSQTCYSLPELTPAEHETLLAVRPTGKLEEKILQPSETERLLLVTLRTGHFNIQP